MSIRKRIALSFIALSTLVYVAPTLLGGLLFYFSLNHALDNQLKLFASSLGHAIEIKSGKPHFRDWAREVQTDPRRSLFTIQLFDGSGNLLEAYGVPGIPVLMRESTESQKGTIHVRSFVSPLTFENRSVGYLQIQVPTDDRDLAMEHFAIALAFMAPIVLLGLGAASFYVSDKATVGIRKNMETLRQLLADASHELNTPLSVINASTESLQRKLLKQEQQYTDLDVISSSADRMRKIIEDLSLLAEMDAGGVAPMKMEPTDISEIVEQGLTEFSVRFEQKGLKLTSTELAPSTVHGNADALRMMFFNLLENALRYTDKGTVAVSLTSTTNNFIVSVADSGIGIPADSVPLIFDRFYRVDKSRSRGSGGSGLGLAIAKAVATSHGGDISVTSQPGVGSKFTITLPHNTHPTGS